MEVNENKIKNAIDFYVFANKLKYINIYNTNQTQADHIYGSMILATALNSEFNFTDNLGKVIRLLVFEELIDNPCLLSYLDNLSKKEKYIKEIDELKSKTNETKFAMHCMNLDIKLNKLFESNKYKKISCEDLYEKAIEYDIFVPKNEEEYQKYKEIFRFYYMNQKLKNKNRSGWDKKHWNVNIDRIENISGHVYGTVVLGLVLDSEFDFKIDIDKVINTIVIHEVGEILIGDITPFDGITVEQKRKIEHEAIIKVVGNLSKKDELINLIFEFDEQKTNEAKFGHWCDKLENDIQAKIYQDNGCHRSLKEQQNNIVFKNPKVQKMIENGAKTVFDIFYEWDKTIYVESTILTKTLKYVKDNRLK